jgi:hypothetical protein
MNNKLQIITNNALIQTTMAQATTAISNIWLDKMSKMLTDEDENSFDLTLIVEGQKIKCHKFMLVMASEVFKAMFKSQMREFLSGEVVITDFSADVVRSMLKCIYVPGSIKTEMAGNVLDKYLFVQKYQIDELIIPVVDSIIASDSVDLCDKYLFADNYDICDLKAAAVQQIIDQTNEDTVVKHFLFGDQNGLADVKDCAALIIAKNMPKYISSPEDFVKFSCDQIQHIIQVLSKFQARLAKTIPRRYWRIRTIDKEMMGGFWYVKSTKLFDSKGCLVSGRLMASSHYGNHVDSEGYLTDSREWGSRWCAKVDQSDWYGVDLGLPGAWVTKLTILHGAGEYGCKHFEVQCSHDRVTWETLMTVLQEVSDKEEEFTYTW